MTDVHDIGLVNSSDAVSTTRLGVLECIASDALGRLPCNQFDRLHNTVNNLLCRWSVEASRELRSQPNKLRAQCRSTLPRCSLG